MGDVYHTCPEREWFASFEKLDGGLVLFGDGHTCQGISTIHIQLSDGIVRELKDARYVSQLKKNLISVRALEAHGMRETFGEGILKMSKGLLVVLKSINAIICIT